VPFGTYHVVNSGTLTTRETVELIRKSRVCTKEFRFFDAEADFLRHAVKTPRSHCILDNSKGPCGRPASLVRHRRHGGIAPQLAKHRQSQVASRRSGNSAL
jgi:hypothetical protein